MNNIDRSQGTQAYIDGKSKADCPYPEDYNGGDYWESSAGKRQLWISGFNTASMSNEIMIKCRRWPRFGWRDGGNAA